MSERKPDGYWKDERNVLCEIAAWRAEHGGAFPTQTLLSKSGNSMLAIAIHSFGGFRKLREKEGEKQLRQTDMHWKNFERVRAAIEAWRAEHGRYPSKLDLDATGHAGLSNAISRHHGGFLAVRKRLGESLDDRPYGYWKDFENVRAVIEAFRAEHGRFPSSSEMDRISGAKSLSNMIARHHGGMNKVRSRLGVPIAQERKDHWKDFENVRAPLEEFQRANGRLPTHKDLVSAGIPSVSMAISKYHSGFAAVRARMGEPDARARHPKGHWENFENVATAILEWVNANGGRFPTSNDLAGTILSSLPDVMAKRYGGAAAVRERLGLGPIADETIAAHADALARIVPAVSSSSTELWSAMRARWVVRDLKAAIAAYEADQTVDRFVQLLTP